MATGPESTAARVALWRALHAQVDAPPHVLEDDVGLKLLAPPADWRSRQDMDLSFTRGIRASIVSRARAVEDLVAERRPAQYVILGAGLDTFAQRRPELASQMTVFEVDQPGPQEWKKQRLAELGYSIPPWLRFVPVNFEAQGSWMNELRAAGFDTTKPALVSSTGVSMYLTREAIVAMLRQIAALARGSTLAMTYLLPVDLVAPEDKPMQQIAERGARASGTPFISFFAPEQIEALARECGFSDAAHVSAADYARRYFGGRADGLRPATGEEMLIATV